MTVSGLQKIQAYLRRHPYRLAAGGVILLTVLLRVYLITTGWAPTDSDESTTGLTALHIAFYGDHPIFFYGETYMGALEAYLAAIWFKLFGPSVFGMRIGIVGMFAVFLATLYALMSRLYSRSLALLAIIVLSLGSGAMWFRETEAAGGYPETLCCAAALFLLALLAHRVPVGRQQLGLYALWGVIAGIGLWSDMLILPWLIFSGGVLAWDWLHHHRWLAVVAFVLGLCVGAFPLLYFDLHAPPGTNSLTVLEHQIFNAGGTAPLQHAPTLGQRLAGTVLVSLPLTTGGTTLCSIKSGQDWPLGANSSTQTIICTAERGIWGVGFIVLGLIAATEELAMLWRIRRKRDGKVDALVLPVTRLAVLSSAGMTLLAYAFSPVPALTPASSSRYLTGLFIAIPAVLWPIWRRLGDAWRRNRYVGTYAGFVSVWCLIFVFLIGTIGTLNVPPNIARTNAQRAQLIAKLQQLHTARFYTDYWTCNWVVFLTREHIVCGVLNDQLQLGSNRYPPYLSAVQATPHPPYVFLANSPQAAVLDHQHFARRITIGQYVIYLSS